jgi:MinD superfamily P-loop ATPase
MSHARLIPGEENSGKLVTFVRQNAKIIAEDDNYELILNDGSPGIGCPVIASLAGVDLGFVVVEPTLSGIHDLKRALTLLEHFKIKSLVCINKYDINRENTDKIVEFCKLESVDVVGKIPFDSLITKAMVVGKSIIEYSPKSMTSRTISDVWKQTLKILNS